MATVAQKVVIQLRSRRPVAETTAARRVVARTVLGAGHDFELIGFRAGGGRLLCLVACDRRDAGQFARRVEIALAKRLRPGEAFLSAAFVPVLDQEQLREAFVDLITPIPGGPDSFCEASNLWDLLGLRTIGLYTAATVRALLPRVTWADLLSLLGVSTLDEVPQSLAALPEATAAAAALPGLRGRTAEVVLARRAAVQVATGRIRDRETAALLGVGIRSVERLRTQHPDPRLCRAIERQLALRAHVDESPDV